MVRLFSARMVIIRDEEQRNRGDVLQVANNWDLWWNPQSPEQAVFFKSKVKLGENFFNEIVNHPFPIDMRILREIKGSALGIDLYTTLTYRVSYLKEPTAISWRQLHAQFGSDYEGNKGVYEFTREAKRQLEKIKLAWPSLNYETPRGRLKLYPSEPSVPQLL